MQKRIVKSSNDKKLCGVCAGVADYFDIDPTLVRVAWGILFFAYGVGLFAYIVCAIVFPSGTTRN